MRCAVASQVISQFIFNAVTSSYIVRLTSIKLAGFKSFVDPTTIRTPGQLVGIVGPNGCGKSNVMDAVRWVLGESKASELRGESMLDVIFNGAGDRKPVGRASVELVFDNSMGRIGGAWAQYAELSIKRVLTREADASYYINNQQVRRRDIHDLFLGTGLGPRAYAIIGQGMISRIIEAKPEELRVFLEEAAGVSKYKDRRKETESRLSDARENLVRVDDIRRELGIQAEKLDVQAKVASQYKELDKERTQSRALLYAVRRQDAQKQLATVTTELAAFTTELEAQQANLRTFETEIEVLRQEQFTHNDKLQAAQASFYAANAEVTKNEQQLVFERQRMQRVRDDLALAARRIDEVTAETTALKLEIEGTKAQAKEREAAAKTAQELLMTTEKQIPEAENVARAAQISVAEAQNQLSQVDQAIQLAAANKQNIERTIARLEERSKRLTEERTRLKGPDAQLKDDLQEALDAERADAEAASAELEQLEADDTDFDQKIAEARGAAQLAQTQLGEVKARISALENLQNRLSQSNNESELTKWLRGHGLKDGVRLWQQIEIEAGWEDALEAVLRERLNAVPAAQIEVLAKHGEPPSKLAVFGPNVHNSGQTAPQVSQLRSKIQIKDASVTAALDDWLHGLRVADSLEQALSQRGQLSAGERIVTRAGHVITPNSVTYFKPESEIHGAMARQRELETSRATIATLQPAAHDTQQKAEALERSKRDHAQRLQQSRAAIGTRQRRIYDLELELMQLAAQIENASKRDAQIQAELTELAGQTQAEVDGVQRIVADTETQQGKREGLIEDRERARGTRNEAEVALTKVREALREAERTAREGQYQLRATQDRLQEMQRREGQLNQNRSDSEGLKGRLASELGSILLGPLEMALQALLDNRKTQELSLTGARETQEISTNALRAKEEARMAAERSVEPLRQKLNDRQLKEQAARMSVEQMDSQLAELQFDQEWLVQALPEAPKAGALQGRVESLNKEIDALGPVNLAALEELNEAKTRKEYLDSQGDDLTEAVNTLEDAIRRIDKETRALLQDTFDQVNANFARLFPTLFGGGNAKLTLTGDEILEAGVQVMAQPPGKRNSSIQLLSGGEKALTATALVFALFQLNPAPFCLLDEVDAPLDDANTERFVRLVREMSINTQFLFISHNKLAMEMAEQLIGITMPEPGISRMVTVDMAAAMRMAA
jgi:chromosome segregation protein